MFATRSSQKSRDPAPKDRTRANKRRMLQRRNANYLDLNDDSTISSSLVQKFKTSSNAESYRQSGSSGRNSSRLEGLRKSLQSLAKDIHKDSAELTSLIKESLSRTDSNPRQEEDRPPPSPGSELKELKETIRQLTKGVSSENKQIKSLLQNSLASDNNRKSSLVVAQSDNDKAPLGGNENPDDPLVRQALDEVKANVKNLGRVFRELIGRRAGDTTASCTAPQDRPKNLITTADSWKLLGGDTQRSLAFSGTDWLSSCGSQSQTMEAVGAPRVSATDSILLEALEVMRESIRAMSKASRSEVAVSRTPADASSELPLNTLSEIRKCLQAIEELKSRRSENLVALDASVAAAISGKSKGMPLKSRMAKKRQKTVSRHKRRRESSSEEEEEESEADDDDDDYDDLNEKDDENEDSDEEDSDAEEEDEEEEEEDADDDIEEEEEEPPSPRRRAKKTPAKKTTSRRKFKVEEEKRGRGSRRHLADGDVEKPTGERRVRRRLKLRMPLPTVAEKACQRSPAFQGVPAGGFFAPPAAPPGISYWMPPPQALYAPLAAPRWYPPTAQPAMAPANNNMSAFFG